MAGGRAGRARVLIVEDSPLIALSLAELVEAAGAEVVGPAARLAAGLEFAREAPLDAAIVDLNLDGEMAWEIAYTLRARGVPFALVTGYERSTALPPDLAGATLIGKPFLDHEITQWLARALAGPGEAG